MGPEGALAVTGVVLAGPGLALTFRGFGSYIVRRVNTIKKAPQLVLELRNVGRSVCEGRLQASLEIAENAFERDVHEGLRIDLVRGLEEMREKLLRIDELLQKLVGEKNTVNRFKLALPPLWTWSPDARKIIRDFEKAQSNFQITISLIEGCHRMATSIPEPLSSTKFKPILKLAGFPYTPLAEDSHIWEGSAEIRDEGGNPTRTQVIVEYAKESPRELIASIARHLVKTKHQSGLLKCLGYHHHRDENPYLVFQVPKNVGNLSTLQDTMLKTPTSDNGPGGGYTLDSRIRLAHLISISVLSVFNGDFVHKNIRPDTILLLRPLNLDSAQSLISATPYLTYWTMLRKASDLSDVGGETSWVRNIYRHPQRAGLQPQERYNIGHDIYSLGVCLLEVGLWESLIVTKMDSDDASELTLSDRYLGMAIELRLVEPDALMEFLTKPRTVMKVLVALAERSLPQRMGTKYAHVVVACLTCFDQGLREEPGEELDFERNSTSVALRFKMVVVETLAQMY